MPSLVYKYVIWPLTIALGTKGKSHLKRVEKNELMMHFLALQFASTLNCTWTTMNYACQEKKQHKIKCQAHVKRTYI